MVITDVYVLDTVTMKSNPPELWDIRRSLMQKCNAYMINRVSGRSWKNALLVETNGADPIGLPPRPSPWIRGSKSRYQQSRGIDLRGLRHGLFDDMLCVSLSVQEPNVLTRTEHDQVLGTNPTKVVWTMMVRMFDFRTIHDELGTWVVHGRWERVSALNGRDQGVVWREVSQVVVWPSQASRGDALSGWFGGEVRYHGCEIFVYVKNTVVAMLGSCVVPVCTLHSSVHMLMMCNLFCSSRHFACVLFSNYPFSLTPKRPSIQTLSPTLHVQSISPDSSP